MSRQVPLEPGSSYLVQEKRPGLSYRLFAARVGLTVPGLIITRQPPDRVRQERSLPDVRVIWLSHTPGDGVGDPTKLGDLAKLIQEFIDDNHEDGVILLDGIEYLILNNGFLQTLMFVEHVNEFIMQRRAILLIPVSPGTLEEKQLALLKRNMRGLRTLVRLIPRRAELVHECELLLDLLPVNSDIDDSLRPLEETLNEARQSRIPFVVVISGGESSSRILHVIDYQGRETWMSLESLERARDEMESGAGW